MPAMNAMALLTITTLVFIGSHFKPSCTTPCTYCNGYWSDCTDTFHVFYGRSRTCQIYLNTSVTRDSSGADDKDFHDTDTHMICGSRDDSVSTT